MLHLASVAFGHTLAFRLLMCKEGLSKDAKGNRIPSEVYLIVFSTADVVYIA